jgi:drug/metabolite transporter (DMT)-like permease
MPELFNTREVWIAAIIAMIGVVLLVLGYRYWNTPQRKLRRQAQQLYRELCRAHRLEWGSVRLLNKLVASHHLAHPAVIFVRPELFLPANLPPPLKRRAERVEQLRARLFIPRDL